MDDIKTLSARVTDTSDDGLRVLVEYAYSDDTTFTTWVDVPTPDAPHETPEALQAAVTGAVRDEVQGPHDEEDATVVTFADGALA